MKQYIQSLLLQGVDGLKSAGAIPADFVPKIMVEASKDKTHGDYASNIAMLLRKPMGLAPRDAAEKLVAALPKSDRIARIEIAGPGFINFYVTAGYLGSRIESMLSDGGRFGVAKTASPVTVVCDYSSPNVAKEMAVHHIRSTVIGDACARMLEFLGNKVVRANHIGDWGTQFGMLIAYLEKMENESGADLDLSDFEAFYRAAKKEYDEDPAFAEKARGYVVRLQGGDDYCRRMWKKLVDMTMAQNQRIYDRMNVSLKPSDVMGESMYNPMLPEVVADLQKKGLAVKSEGADVVFLKDWEGKDGKPMAVIIRKSDGGYLYTTTDIACAKYRVEHFGAKRVLYFVDSRQHQHLLQAWEIARMAGYIPDDVVFEHESFGMMLGKDGRPFKTRSGGTVKLAALLDEAESRAAELLESRASDLSDDEKQKVIHEVAVGAVKYADLSKNRTTDYVFDWDNMLSFDGNTAPYLQYAYTRIRSIFRNAGEAAPGKVILSEEIEKELAQKLTLFSDAVVSAADKAMPNILCSYLYELSGMFMSFYEKCPVNKDGVPDDVRASRLSLCAAVAGVLKLGLSLLGINVLERM